MTSGINAALAVMLKELDAQSSRFVFPSEAAASHWSRRICAIAGIRSVAGNRFLAWDRFKEEAVRSQMQDRLPVNAVMRKLFVERLIQKNAASPLFRSLIPPAFAGDASVFVPSLTAMLPSLSLWEKRGQRQGADMGGNSTDEEDRDLSRLKLEYAAFLDLCNLFEPSWEKPPLNTDGRDYYIFFPEAMEDFCEYEAILEDEPLIHIIRIDESEERDTLYRYESVRAEIRGTLLKIRGFHERDGIPYEDMALNVAGLEDMEPYLLRECALYNVPFRLRSGRPLGQGGAGRMFSLIRECVDNSFAFSSLKSLLLNQHIPWKDSEKNMELVLFGIKNNCVSAYREKGREIDIWEEAFKRSRGEETLKHYYKKLKETLTSLVSARSFREIRKRYFIFRGSPWDGDNAGFLSRDACTVEADAVLARCIEELSALVELEEEYPYIVPAEPFSPFSFFLSLLLEKRYVAQGAGSGLNIFPYRVAAAAPYRCHFVLNASQDAATVLYRPLAFLSQDKRKRLGVSDTDASASFFRLYHIGSLGKEEGRAVISVSDQGLSGWAIPHSFFAVSHQRIEPPLADPFPEEKSFWGNGVSLNFPSRLFPVQKEGFEKWSLTLNASNAAAMNIWEYADTRNSGAGAAAALRGRINGVQYNGDGAIRVSATDLNEFFFCPLYWLFGKVFGIAEFSPEAKLLDERSLGNLYHEILKNLFARIRREDRRFMSTRLDIYKEWARELTMEAALSYPAFQGPLASPLISAQAEAISKRLAALLKTEAKYFDGYEVGELEGNFEFFTECRGEEVLLNGKIDRVSIAADDVPVIIDYKTGTAPTKKESSIQEDGGIANFQIALYMFLYEKNMNVRVEGAFFASIHKNELTAIVGKPLAKKGYDREEFQVTLNALEEYVGNFVNSMKALDFSPENYLNENRFVNCAGCQYKTVCRTAYNLNSHVMRKRGADYGN